MKTKMLASFLVIALVAAVVGGASMAYFTAKTDAPENVFVAGTVMIEAGEEFVWDAEKMDNVNPGDCFSKCVQIYNTGTKLIELRLVDMNFIFEIDWDWICANWGALCFSKIMIDGEPKYPNCAALQEAILAAIAAGRVTNPAHANGSGDGIFDNDGNFIVPVMAAPCPGSNWVMKYVGGTMEFYYAGGPLAPGKWTELCVVVVFDGPWMGNLWQGATFTMGGGMFQAIQASNNAPTELWGLGWNDCFISSPQVRLAKIDPAYADYFYGEQGNFLFADCCRPKYFSYSVPTVLWPDVDGGLMGFDFMVRQSGDDIVFMIKPESDAVDEWPIAHLSINVVDQTTTYTPWPQAPFYTASYFFPDGDATAIPGTTHALVQEGDWYVFSIPKSGLAANIGVIAQAATRAPGRYWEHFLFLLDGEVVYEEGTANINWQAWEPSWIKITI